MAKKGSLSVKAEKVEVKKEKSTLKKTVSEPKSKAKTASSSKKSSAVKADAPKAKKPASKKDSAAKKTAGNSNAATKKPALTNKTAVEKKTAVPAKKTAAKTADKKTAEKKINICFICDDNYAMPTGVAITSLKLNRNTELLYNIYIIQNGLKQENLTALKKLSDINFTINFLDGTKIADYSSVSGIKSANHVSTSALYKFNLPEIFPKLDRILYLDGDVLIRDSLEKLYFIDFEDNYAAACPDMGAEFFVKQYNLRLGTDFDYYFNSGVLLLNLNLLRNEKTSEKLLDYRINGKNDFMDQDAFNVCFAGKIKWISFLYNFTVTSYEKFYADTICNYYHIENQTKEELYLNAKIVHLCSLRKPWKYIDAFGSEEWLGYFVKSTFLNFGLKRIKMDLANSDFFSHSETEILVKQIPSTPVENPAVSVITPVYNSEKYLKTCIESLMLQKFSNAEFIFVDDGSSDKSLEILKEYQKIDNRIVVFSQNNKGPGIARNSGIAMAKGKYITFLDSDDVMESECLKSFYELAEKMNCDLVICKANCFGEDISKKKIAGWCLRKEFLPLKHVFTPEDAQKNLFLISAGAPWGKFYRTSLIRDNNIQFPDLPRAEDFSFVYTCFVLAKKITTISAELINYRMLDNSSSLETAKDKFPTATAQGHKILYERLNALSVYDTYKNAFENNFIHSVTNQLNSFKEENSKKLLEKALRELNENFLKIDFSDISRFVFKNETMNLMKIIDLKKYNEYNKTPIIENTNITPKIVQNNVTILNDKKKSDKKISRKIKTAKRVFKEEGMRGIFKVIKGKISN